MPVKKFKTFEEAREDVWNFYPDGEWIKRTFRLFKFSRFKKKHHIKKGIQKYNTFEEAQKDDGW